MQSTNRNAGGIITSSNIMMVHTTISMMMISFFFFLVIVADVATALVVATSSSSSSSMPPMTTKTADHMPLAQKAMSYFDKGSDPFHVVDASADLLKKAGFEELADKEPYKGKLEVGGKYFFTRNKSTLVAFTIGNKFSKGNGFKVLGAHTDSPHLKVKPRSKRGGSGCTQIGVECYGGGLWHTWFDRDLGISGRVLVRTEDNQIEQRLVKIDRSLLRISNLAIHLQTADERKAFKVNKEDHLSPILAMAAKKALTGEKSDSDDDDDDDDNDKGDDNDNNNKDGWTEHQEPALLQLIANELDVDVSAIADFELSLFDVQKAAIGGAYSEFIHSARLDNLASCFIALEALIHQGNENLMDDEDISMICLYDHEEVGSSSAVGAASPIMKDAVRRISAALGCDDADSYESCISKSFVLSSDQAHAIHPNYASKHEKQHAPKMNDGMVIKRNSNQRYATTSVTGFIIREIAKRAGLPPVQEFIVRQDCGCGSTIGPMISTATGIRTIDMGCPQLSMHSIRETMGVCDLTNGLALFKAFFEKFREVDDDIN